MKNLLINRALAAKKKKLFSLFLALVASAGTIFASDREKVDGIWYIFDSSTQTASVVSVPSGYGYSDRYTGSIVIPASVTYYGTTYSVTSIVGAFFGCGSVTSVTIPNSVTSIGESAFKYCTGLTSVTIPNSVTSIGGYAFEGCTGLTSFEIPNSVTSIGQDAFSGCSGLTSVTIPNSVTSIGSSAFDNCRSLTSVTIPNSVTSIKSNTFYRCYSLTSVTIPNSVTSIGGSAFEDCRSLTSVTIPNSVTSIGWSAFNYCTGLTSITIGNSVTSIGHGDFAYCTGLKNVILGSSVKVLEGRAFYRCSSIETITCYSTRPPTVNPDALYGLGYSTIVYVPADYLETYKMTNDWRSYDVRPLGAKSTETTDVNVTPAENTADVAWPAVSGAATYELVIKDKNGNVICTLTFNANGQLTQIAFNAPVRNNAPQQTQAAGFSFTVTGLEEGTSYDLTITSKDNNGSTLDTKTISFTTSGEAPQGIDQVPSDQVQSTKVIRDGQVFILRGDKTYTLTGQETIMP